MPVERLEQFLRELGTPIGNIAGQPAVEPHYYVMAFRQTYESPSAGQSTGHSGKGPEKRKRGRPKAEPKQQTELTKPKLKLSKDELDVMVDELIDQLVLTDDDFNVLDQRQLTTAEAAEVLTYGDRNVRALVAKGELYKDPATNKICARSIVLRTHKIADPRLNKEEENG